MRKKGDASCIESAPFLSFSLLPLRHRVHRAEKERQAVHAGDHKGKRPVQIHLHHGKVFGHGGHGVRRDGGKGGGLAALFVHLDARGVLHLRHGDRLVKAVQVDKG